MSKSKEIKFEVPFGYIAGKEWGPPDGIHVLGIHGWMDNAATFDGIAPYLPPDIHLVVMDYSGNGFSSHIPIGARYSRLQMMTDLRRFVKALGWKKFSIIGHSLGGVIGIMYCIMYPNEVNKIVVLESIISTDILGLLQIEEVVDTMLRVESYEQSEQRRAFTMEEARKTYIRTRKGINEEGLTMLLARGTRPSRNDPEKVEFVHDIRYTLLPVIPHEFDNDEDKLELLKKMKVPMLMILSSPPTLVTQRIELNVKALEIFQQMCPYFRLVEIEGGGHYIHFTRAEKVAELTIDFLRTKF